MRYGLAPIAMRTPISRVRWLTAWLITPKTPIAASINADDREHRQQPRHRARRRHRRIDDLLHRPHLEQRELGIESSHRRADCAAVASRSIASRHVAASGPSSDVIADAAAAGWPALRTMIERSRTAGTCRYGRKKDGVASVSTPTCRSSPTTPMTWNGACVDAPTRTGRPSGSAVAEDLPRQQPIDDDHAIAPGRVFAR